MIPAEAIEAAHAAVYGDEAPMLSRQAWLEEALEAAAPYMQAEAWDEGYDRAESDHYGTGFWTTRLRGNPYRPAAERGGE